MRILGIDPGSLKCGYGVIDAVGSNLTYVECGVLTASGSDPYQRIATIGLDLEALITEFQIEEGAIEGGFVKSRNGALTLGAARGVAAYTLARVGIPVAQYDPATVKKAVTSSGRAEKEAVAHIVRVRLRLKSTPTPDAADALGVAVCHAQLLNVGAAVGARRGPRSPSATAAARRAG